MSTWHEINRTQHPRLLGIAKADKSWVEKAIATLLKEFTEKHGLSVETVYVRPEARRTDGTITEYHVEIEARL